MPADQSNEIAKLLTEGKTSAEIIGMGHPKEAVYRAQRTRHQSKEKPPGKNAQARAKKHATAPSTSPPPEAESDPEIVELAKELRKAELRKQLVTLSASSDLEGMSRGAKQIGLMKRRSCGQWEQEQNICGLWEWSAAADVPEGIGETLLDDKNKWRLRPSALYCAMCSAELQQQIRELEERARRIPFRDFRENFTCGCGAKGMVAVSTKCTECGREAWWGWWPDRD